MAAHNPNVGSPASHFARKRLPARKPKARYPTGWPTGTVASHG
jgi:hypothetical protein